MTRKFRILLPTLRPVGGIQKCFDYANHAESLGYEVIFHVNEKASADREIFLRDDFSHFCDRDPSVFASGRVPFSVDDLYFFSLPSDFSRLEPLVQFGLSTRNIIHIIQNTRHANADFQNGYAVRLLSRPMARIAINDVVKSAIGPHLHPGSICEVIQLGHRTTYFEGVAREPGLNSPIRVGYTCWKSDLGDRVADRLASDSRFAFQPVRDFLGWPALRAFYREIDVFLCTPNRQEGFYLPGLEAMASECLVATPDVGGNMAYCVFGRNSLPYAFGDLEAAVETLAEISDLPSETIAGLREEGRETVRRFSIEKERRNFADFLERLPIGG